MKELLENIIEKNRIYTNEGNLASYIPELKKANKDVLGVCINTLDGKEYVAGDYKTKFTMQSIANIISLMIAIMENGEEYVFSKVGVETTSEMFNSIISLEAKSCDKPLNPMINSGAIAIVSLIKGNTPEEIFDKIIKLTREITNNDQIEINKDVYNSEKRTGDRNRALAHFMKSTGIIEKNVDEVLDVYFKQCSIEVSCSDISKIGLFLANNGVLPHNGKRLISKKVAKVIKAIMMTSGMYNASGDVAAKVGIPCKSGVGGGILATVPKKLGIGIIGPSLDRVGNSIAGIKVLEDISEELQLNIF